MRRCVAAVSLLLLSGCGSCLEDKKVPEVEETPSKVKTVVMMKTMEGGAKRPIVVVDEPIDFSSVLDAGR